MMTPMMHTLLSFTSSRFIGPSFAPRLCALLLLASGPLCAAPGDMDATFGVQGLARLPGRAETSVSALRVEAGGRILAGGSTSLARYLPSGLPDAGFGTQGVAQLAFTSQVTRSAAIALWQGEAGRARALMSGPVACFSPGLCTIQGLFSSDYMAARRFNDSGGVEVLPGDEVGGQSAVATVRSEGRTLLWTPEGGLLVVGLQYDFSLGNVVRVFRYGPDGALSDGLRVNALPAPAQRCLLPEPGTGPAPVQVTGGLDSSRRLTLAVRRVTLIGGEYSLCLMRFLPDGSLDASFGSNGVTLLENSSALQLSLRQPLRLFTRADQSVRLLLTEGSFTDARKPVWLSLGVNGSVDLARGQGTGVEPMILTPLASIRDVLQLPDGRFAMTGYFLDGTTNLPHLASPLVATYGVDGLLPDLFGAGSGATSRPLFNTQGRLEPSVLAAAADGTIYVGGSWISQGNTAGEFAVTRLEGLPPPTSPAASGGGGGGGGGCGTLDPSSGGPVDPLLPFLLLAALLAISGRARGRR